MATNLLLRLTKKQFQYLLTAIIVVVYATTSFLFGALFKTYQIPTILPAFLIVIPMALWRKRAKPEEREPFNFKVFLITAACLIGFALLAIVVSEWYLDKTINVR